MIVMLTGLFIAGIVNVIIKILFINSPGGVVVVNFWENLHNYLIPWSYMKAGITFGVISPEGFFAGTLVVIVIIMLRGWSGCPCEVRRHLIISAIINFPLFLLFCATGELRNLSLMYVGFVIIMALIIDRDRDRKFVSDQE